jgi:hypothetical protein
MSGHGERDLYKKLGRKQADHTGQADINKLATRGPKKDEDIFVCMKDRKGTYSRLDDQPTH